jgi:AcrR family transcriptional regulator
VSTEPAGRRAPRSDAQANRERLLAAAAAQIKARGNSVPMAEIADRAGVGVGTLYRHFPTREHLLGALTSRAFALVLGHARAAAAAPGPAADAVGQFFAATIECRDQLVLPMHGGPADLDDEARQLQAEIRVVLGALLRRGRRDGSIRAGVTPGDVIIAAAQLAQPLATVENWDRQARRQARIYLAGLRPPATKPL